MVASRPSAGLVAMVIARLRRPVLGARGPPLRRARSGRSWRSWPRTTSRSSARSREGTPSSIGRMRSITGWRRPGAGSIGRRAGRGAREPEPRPLRLLARAPVPGGGARRPGSSGAVAGVLILRGARRRAWASRPSRSSPVWWGGHSFGPRLLADVLPAVVLGLVPIWPAVRRRALARALFALAFAVSVLVEIVGAFYFPSPRDVEWNMSPAGRRFRPRAPLGLARPPAAAAGPQRSGERRGSGPRPDTGRGPGRTRRLRGRGFA